MNRASGRAKRAKPRSRDAKRRRNGPVHSKAFLQAARRFDLEMSADGLKAVLRALLYGVSRS